MTDDRQFSKFIKVNLKIFCSTLLLILSGLAKAQSPVNAFMQGKGNGQVSLSQTIENYNDFYLASSLVEGVPVFEKIAIQSTSLYLNYGLKDNIDLVLNLPHVSARGSSNRPTINDLGFQNLRRGLQDMSIFIKMRVSKYEWAAGNLNWVNALGLELPASNYPVNEGFQSILAIGNQSQRLSLRSMGMFQFPSGMFFSLTGGYVAKNRKVPDAIVSEAKVGLAQKDVYVELFFENQHSITGSDILGLTFDGFFPATRVNFSKAGMSIYKPIGSGFGMSLAGSMLLTGRNIGNASAFSIGLGYAFGPENMKLNQY